MSDIHVSIERAGNRDGSAALAALAWETAAIASAVGNYHARRSLEDGSSDGDVDLTGRRILVCEDEVLVAIDIAHSVEEAGGEVVGPAASIEDGLKELDRKWPDAAILDVNLLDGDVTPILQRLLDAGVPVVVNTGTKLPDEVTNADIPVFIKPTAPEDLIAALKF